MYCEGAFDIEMAYVEVAYTFTTTYTRPTPNTTTTPTTMTATPISVKIGMAILGILLFILFVSLGLLMNRYSILTRCEFISLRNKFLNIF